MLGGDIFKKKRFQDGLMNQFVINTSETARLAGAHTLLQKKMLFWLPDEGDYSSTLLYGFTATRREHIEQSGVTEKMSWPTIGIVVQGSKYLEVDGKRYHCGERNCFVGGIGATDTSRVTTASADSPHLSISLELDSRMLVSLAKVSGTSPSCACSHSSVMAQADLGMLDAFFRLVNLIADPELFFCLAPLVVREIHYRMLNGPLGKNVRKRYFRQGFSLDNASSSNQPLVRL